MSAKTVTLNITPQSKTWIKTSAQVLLGTLYVALLSQVKIPLQPIAMTMQTFAVFSLALFLGSRKAFCSLILYLVAATAGLPVLAGMNINPLWMLSPAAGYYLSFPLAAYIVGKGAEKSKGTSSLWMVLGLCLAQTLIFVLGVTWLSFFIGFKDALVFGLYPFLLFDLIKLCAAFSTKQLGSRLAQIFSFY